MRKTTDTFEILAATKLSYCFKPKLTMQVEQVTQLLILASNFKMNSRLDNTQSYFSEMHEMPLTRMHRKQRKRTVFIHWK